MRFRLRGCHPLWPAFPDRLTNAPHPTSWSCNPGLSLRIVRFRLIRVRSPLLAESLLFSSPPGTEMFQFSGCRPLSFRSRSRRMNGGGLPHSEIPGSKPVCGSPELIAAYHVLHRLLVPSHPPSALSSGERTGKSLNAICVKPKRVADRGLWDFRGGQFGALAKLKTGSLVEGPGTARQRR